MSIFNIRSVYRSKFVQFEKFSPYDFLKKWNNVYATDKVFAYIIYCLCT